MNFAWDFDQTVFSSIRLAFGLQLNAEKFQRMPGAYAMWVGLSTDVSNWWVQLSEEH